MTESRRPTVLGPKRTSLDERVLCSVWAAAMVSAPLNGLRIGSFTLCDLLLAVAILGTVASRAFGRRRLDVSGYGGVLAGLALITCGGLLAAGLTPATGASLLGTFTFVFTTAGLVAALALWAPSRSQVRWFCALWLAGAVASSLWALLGTAAVAGRRFGLASHPNSLGLVCVLGTGLALGFALSARGKGLPRYFAGASWLTLMGALFSSGSRAALLGVVSALPGLAVFSSRRGLVLLTTITTTAAVGAAVLVGVLHTPSQGHLGRFLGDPSTAESDALRVGQLARSLDRVAEHPVTGAGFEYAGEAHSIYLQVLVAAGPLGVIGLVVASWSVLVAARRGMGSQCETMSGDRGLLAGLAGGYVGYLVAAVFQNSLSARYVWLYVAVTLALARELHYSGNSLVSAASLKTSATEILGPRRGEGAR